MTETGFIRVAAAAEVPVGAGIVVKVGARQVALFNVEGSYYAIDNTCPHRGGPLGEGDLDGRVVTCPWHAWAWDVTTGGNVNNPAVKVACYPLALEDGAIFVQVPEAGGFSPEGR